MMMIIMKIINFLFSLSFPDLVSYAITIGHAMNPRIQHYIIPKSIYCTVVTKNFSKHIPNYVNQIAIGKCWTHHTMKPIGISVPKQKVGMAIVKQWPDPQRVWSKRNREI